MPSKQNISELKKIQEKKEESKNIVFTHYRGLTVNQVSELRQKIKDAGGEMLVTKNTLLRVAFDQNETLNEILTGPTAAVFAYEDEIAPLKVIADFNKENKLPKFTGGYMDGQVINADQVKQLSKLPGKDQLRGQLVGTLSAPITGFLNVIQGNTRNLVYALKAIQEKKA